MRRSQRTAFRRRRTAAVFVALALLCGIGYGAWRLVGYARANVAPPEAGPLRSAPVSEPTPPAPTAPVQPPVDPRAGFSASAALLASTRPADPGAPPAPLGLAVTLKPEGNYLTWRSGGGTVACWQVYRITESGARVPLTCVPATVGHVLDNPVELRPQGLVYTVTAKDKDNHESADSTPALQAAARTLQQGWRGNTSVGQRLLADLKAAQPGDQVDFRPFDGDSWVTPAKVEALPGEPVRRLIFSDSPETIATPGIAYQSDVSGPVRIYYYHVNSLKVGGVAPSANVGVILTNRSGKPASYRITRQAGGAPASPNKWEALTREVTRLWLSDESQVAHAAEVAIPAGESRLLDSGAALTALGQEELVHNIYDLTVSGLLQATVVMTQGDPLAAFTAGGLKPLTPDAGHDRGTFPSSEVTLRFDLPTDGFGRLWLAPGPGLGNLTGTDAITAKPVTLAGNYGVQYHIQTKAPVDGTLVINPLGGDYAGPVRKPSQPPLLVPSKLMTAFDSVAVIGHYKAGEPIVLDWMPPALSSLPVRLLYLPDRP